MAILFDPETFITTEIESGASVETFMRGREYREYILSHEERSFIILGDYYFCGEANEIAVSGFKELTEWPEKKVRIYDEDIKIWREVYQGGSVNIDYRPYKAMISDLLSGHTQSQKNTIVSFDVIDEYRQDREEA